MLRRVLAPRPALLPALLPALALVVVSGCRREAEDTAPPHETSAPTEATSTTPAECASPTETPACRTTPGLGAIVWTATSAEFRANSLGAYATATLALDKALKDKKTSAAEEQQGSFAKLPPAVVLDIDETVLDNSPYQAWLTREGKSYDPATFGAWVAAAQADDVPGAVEFTKAAAARGVTVFYVSNRDATGEAQTRENLVRLGFPVRDAAEVDVVLLQNERPEWTSAKGSRRASIAERYRIVMLVGDNLGDFTDSYKGSVDERAKVIDAHREWWGSRWIMIANPMYGAWESAAAAPGADAAASGSPIPPAVVTWGGPG